MGAGIPTPLPPASADAISELARAMFMLAEEQKETNRLLRKEFEPKSPYMEADEAAAAFGHTNTRCLKYVIDKLGLQPTSLKPRRFKRADVERIADHVRRNDIFIPAKGTG